MNPEERRQLLEERTKTAELLNFPAREAQDPEVERERREQQRKEDVAAVEAFRQRPKSAGEILHQNVDLSRKVLDPRVLLEAVEFGLSDDEMQKKRNRMQRWTEAVMLKPDGETYKQRKLRLQTLHHELYGERSNPGCGCDGKGWMFMTGTLCLDDDKVKPDAEFYRLCHCDRGLAKLDEVKHMGVPRNVARGRGKKADRSDPTPF